MTNTISYAGYSFGIYPKRDTLWKDNSGVYMFVSLNQNQHWDVWYVGQCDSFANRIPSHERWQDAQRHGATHV
jgi:hypothetical protein